MECNSHVLMPEFFRSDCPISIISILEADTTSKRQIAEDRFFKKIPSSIYALPCDRLCTGSPLLSAITPFCALGLPLTMEKN